MANGWTYAFGDCSEICHPAEAGYGKCFSNWETISYAQMGCKAMEASEDYDYDGSGLSEDTYYPNFEVTL